MQDLLPSVLPAILDGLADESEGVRNAALAAGHTFVDLYATTALPLLLPAVEAGIVNDNWRIRQSSVDLLGDLLFKVLPRIVSPSLLRDPRSKGLQDIDIEAPVRWGEITIVCSCGNSLRAKNNGACLHLDVQYV